MARTKIDYGIDLGTTNSAISRMENGEAQIIKTDLSEDTMPSCVFVNKKKAIMVGKTAFNALERDKLRAMINADSKDSNSFIEFKRTMGTDVRYSSSNLGKELSSEELSAEVLKTLKSFVKDENVGSVVITVPAAFKNNQKEATRRAAELAGFNQIELLQEPVAASMAYGLDSKKKDGYWIVFDFGGGTFDAALLKVEEGIMKVIDTEGDNYLGGKNLDYAIVDEIIVPFLEANFSITSILDDEIKKQVLRTSMKFYAEAAKIQLSYKDSHHILSELGDIPGVDDDGEYFELDILVHQVDAARVFRPFFQKSIDICLGLLKRNNLSGSSLDSLILVGGATKSPVLRKMLEEQICMPDVSAEPMTAISKGAALYASTIDVSEEIIEESRDRSKIQIEIGHEPSTVELEEVVPIKVLADKTDGPLPEVILAEVIRNDKAWSSGRVEINSIGEIVEVRLIEGKTNVFDVFLYDGKGNLLECEPSSFSIIQGSKIGSATLPFDLGIEIKDKMTGKVLFRTLKGLEKNKSIPATGTRSGLKTQKQIRPGMEGDFIKIPLYEGGYEADGTRAVYNEHVSDITISGLDLPGLLPENSDVDLTVKVDRSEKITVMAYFPYLDHTEEVKVKSIDKSIDEGWLSNEIHKAKDAVRELQKDKNIDAAISTKHASSIDEIESLFDQKRKEAGGLSEVLEALRKVLKEIDALQGAAEWPSLQEELKDLYYKLEKANKDLGDERTTRQVEEFRTQLDSIIRSKDIKLGNVLLDEMGSFFFRITMIYQLIGFVRNYHEDFDSYNWKDPSKARGLLNEGLRIIGQNPTTDELHPIVVSLLNLLPDDERPSEDNTVLVG